MNTNAINTAIMLAAATVITRADRQEGESPDADMHLIGQIGEAVGLVQDRAVNLPDHSAAR